MTTEQGGVSPATAGGASASDELAATLAPIYNLARAINDGLAKAAQQMRQEPDPRDAEIERLRDQLGEVCTALHNQLSDYDECGVFTRDHALYLVRQLGGRVRLRDMTIKAMQEMAKPFSLPDQRGVELEELRKRLVYDLGLSGGQWSGLSVMELLQRLKTMYMTALDEARGRNGGMRAEIEELETQRDDALKHNRELATERNEAHAERDRLRAELDLVREQQPRFRPGQHVRIGLCDAMVVTPKDVTRVQFEGTLLTFDVPTRDVKAVPDEQPAAPRRWVAGDAEPEVSTTVTWGTRTVNWSRSSDGDWDADGDPGQGRLSWRQLLAEAGELVEVVSTDG